MSARFLPPHLCLIGEVCKRLGRSAPVVRRLVERGHLPARRLRGERVFVRADVEAYALRQSEEPELATHVAARMMALGRSDFEILSELDIALSSLHEVRRIYEAHQRGKSAPAAAANGEAALVSRTGDTLPAPPHRPSEPPASERTHP